jgi:uncharacterized membrane protein
MQVMIIDVPSRERGLQILDHVEAVVDVGRYTVRDTALVYRADDGRTRIRQTRDAPTTPTTPAAAPVGGLGALLGLVATPRSATSGLVSSGLPAAGPATPTAGAATVDAAIDDRLINRVAQHIDETNAAVVLLGDDATIDFLSGTADLAEHDIEYVAVAPDPGDDDAAGFTRYG